MNITWAGQNFELLPGRALFWLEKTTLVFSDVHLGKDHNSRGAHMPASVYDEDLQRMGALMQTHQPNRVLVLGDFVHSHKTGLEDLIFRFRMLAKNFSSRWVLALGNHDWREREQLAHWGFDDIVIDVQEDGILFSHDPDEGHAHAVSGCIHPVVQLIQGRDRPRLPCFVVSESRILLPSFASLNDGFEFKASAQERIFVAAHDQIVSL